MLLPLLATGVSAQNGVPASIRIANSHDLPDRIDPGQRTEVELVVVYEYQAGAAASQSETDVNLSIHEAPEWVDVSVRPSEFGMAVSPVGQSTRRNVTLRITPDRLAPALRPGMFALDLHADQNGGIQPASNRYEWFTEVDFAPRISVDLSQHPLVVEQGSSTTTEITVRNLANAPIKPDLRIVEDPPRVQTGVTNEARVLGTERADSDRSLLTRSVLMIEDLGGEWESEHIRLETSYRPAHRPGHPPAFHELTLQVIRPRRGLDLGLVAIGIGGIALGYGLLRYRKRRGRIRWPGS